MTSTSPHIPVPPPGESAKVGEPATPPPGPDASTVSGLQLILGIMLIVIILFLALAVLTIARRGAAASRLRTRQQRTRLGRRNAWEEAGRRAVAVDDLEDHDLEDHDPEDVDDRP